MKSIRGKRIHGLSRLLTGVWATVAGLSVSAMTIGELQSAIDQAADGARVEIENDLEVTQSLNVNGKKITIASPEGKRFVLSRSGDTNFLVSITDSATDVRLENFEFDGHKESGSTSAYVADIRAGKLTLGDGAVFRNLLSANSGPFHIKATGTLTMEDGALINGFENDSYAMAVQVGDGGTSNGTFEMKGGEISDCVSTYGNVERAKEYGGSVYLYGGTFLMSGGLITRNKGPNSVGGLNLYGGKVDVGGTGTIIGNEGYAANDVWYGGGQSFYISSGYTGRMTVAQPTTPVLDEQSLIWAHQGPGSGDYKKVKGVGNVSWQGNPDLILYTYWSASGYTYWKRKCAELSGAGAVAEMGELKDVMKSGDTITFKQDVPLSTKDGYFSFDGNAVTDVTLTSDNGSKLYRSTGNGGWSMIYLQNGANVTIKNLTIDGMDVADYQPLISVSSGAHLELGEGAVVCNARTTTNGGALSINDSGTSVKMLDGAVIRDCTAKGDSCYASAVKVGNGGEPAILPLFEMVGGEITGCETEIDTSKVSVWGGYGGAVYTYTGHFKMTGGRIHGNTSTTTSSAVLYYSGLMEISGTARIEDNGGVYKDLYFNSAKAVNVKIIGDFRGRVGICNGSNQLGGNTYVTMGEGATGAWGLFQCFPEMDVDWCGKIDAQDATKIVWAESVGKVDGTSVASLGDANLACPSVIALDPADIKGVPHTFSGAAAGLTKTIALDFDPTAMKAYLRQHKEGISLLAAVDGAAFTGDISLTLPAGCPIGFRADKIGDTEYRLAYDRGLIMLFR